MIGTAIETILKADSVITAAAGLHIYPITNDCEGIPSIYYKVTCNPRRSKNGSNMDRWTLEVLTMCKTYSESWPLSVAIKNAIENASRQTVENVTFSDVICNTITDDYEFQIDSYGQILNFDIITQNITN